MKSKKMASALLGLLGITAFCFLTMAPTQNGTVLSKTSTLFNASVINGAVTITSAVVPIDDSQYFGIEYFQTGSGPSITLVYDESYDNVNWIATVGTIVTGYSATATPAGQSIQLPVAPLIRFRAIGGGGNGADTAFTLKFMRQ